MASGSAVGAGSAARTQPGTEVADLVEVLQLVGIRDRVDRLDLAVGDVITTEQDVSAPLELSVQGVPKFRARPGAFRGKKAVSIEGLIEE
jgi:flagellar motor switch protein FliM